MSLERETLDRILELGRSEVAVETIDGVPMAARPLADVTPSLHPPCALEVHTLDGLVGYLTANRDNIDPKEVVVHVAGPRLVSVVSGVKGARNERFVYAHAKAPDVVAGIFGNFMGVEDFNVRLMSLFTGAGDRAAIVKLAGKVSAEESITLADDGFSQEVLTKGGVTTVGRQEVKNPVMLAPYRTFREVEQPKSPFLLRFRGGKASPVACALFEADGGAWELAAIANIVVYLLEKLEGYEVIG